AFISLLVMAPLFASQNETHLDWIKRGYFPTLEGSRDLEELLGEIQRGLHDVVTSKDTSALEDTDALHDEFIATAKQMSSYGLRTEAGTEALLGDFDQYYRLARRATTSMRAEGPSEKVVQAFKEARERYKGIETTLQKSTEWDRKQMEEAFVAAIAANRSS